MSKLPFHLKLHQSPDEAWTSLGITTDHLSTDTSFYEGNGCFGECTKKHSVQFFFSTYQLEKINKTHKNSCPSWVLPLNL